MNIFYKEKIVKELNSKFSNSFLKRKFTYGDPENNILFVLNFSSAEDDFEISVYGINENEKFNMGITESEALDLLEHSKIKSKHDVIEVI